MQPHIEIIRPVNCMMTAIAVWIGYIVAGGFGFPIEVLYGMLSALLICAGGMISNDIADIEIDKVNRPERPLPSGMITRKAAITYSWVLYIIGIVFASFVSTGVLSVAVIAALILLAYATKLKKTLLLGNVMVSLLVALTFIYGGLITGNALPTYMLAFLAFLSNIGREIFKSIEDIKGDKKKGVQSLAIKAGIFVARMMASLFILIAVVFSFVPYFIGIFGIVYIVPVIIADALFIAAILSKKSSKLSKFAMLIALIAFIAGGISGNTIYP